MTEAEKRLWWELRHRITLRGSHFRRQVSIGPYIADFCCLGARLILEVDGGQHYPDAGEARDEKRTAYLEGQGFSVLRFTNSTVLSDMDCVIETIAARLANPIVSEGGATPTPNPSPQGGGEWASLHGRQRA